jgi:hypothetical protein
MLRFYRPPLRSQNAPVAQSFLNRDIQISINTLTANRPPSAHRHLTRLVRTIQRPVTVQRLALLGEERMLRRL